MLVLQYILGFILYIKINSSLYFSLIVESIDDCIYNIYKNQTEKIYFKFTNKYEENQCNPFNLYDKPLIKNEPYDFGDIIVMEVKDRMKKRGFVKITVQINEYIIRTYINNTFWECLNCSTSNKDYYFNENRFNFYDDNENNATNNSVYIFTFQVKFISELNNANLEINNSFYELSGGAFNRSLNYKDNELELINFYTTDYFYIRDNNSLPVNYTNYYFKVKFVKEFSGTLKGLNSDNSYINITNNSFFRVNETNGLIYQLSSEEIKKYEAFIKLNITAYNIYLNKNVTKEKSFIFNITVTGDYLKCLYEESQSIPDNNSIYHYLCPDLTQEKLYNNFSEFLLRIEEKKKYEINGSDINIHISPINSIFFESSIQEKMNYCEQILKNTYNI